MPIYIYIYIYTYIHIHRFYHIICGCLLFFSTVFFPVPYMYIYIYNYIYIYADMLCTCNSQAWTNTETDPTPCAAGQRRSGCGDRAGMYLRVQFQNSGESMGVRGCILIYPVIRREPFGAMSIHIRNKKRWANWSFPTIWRWWWWFFSWETESVSQRYVCSDDNSLQAGAVT